MLPGPAIKDAMKKGTMNRAWQQAMPLLLQPVTKNELVNTTN